MTFERRGVILTMALACLAIPLVLSTPTHLGSEGALATRTTDLTPQDLVTTQDELMIEGNPLDPFTPPPISGALVHALSSSPSAPFPLHRLVAGSPLPELSITSQKTNNDKLDAMESLSLNHQMPIRSSSLSSSVDLSPWTETGVDQGREFIHSTSAFPPPPPSSPSFSSSSSPFRAYSVSNALTSGSLDGLAEMNSDAFPDTDYPNTYKAFLAQSVLTVEETLIATNQLIRDIEAKTSQTQNIWQYEALRLLHEKLLDKLEALSPHWMVVKRLGPLINQSPEISDKCYKALIAAFNIAVELRWLQRNECNDFSVLSVV